MHSSWWLVRFWRFNFRIILFEKTNTVLATVRALWIDLYDHYGVYDKSVGII